MNKHPIYEKDKCYISLKYGIKYPNTSFFIKRGLANKPHRGVDFGVLDKYKGTPIFLVAPVSGTVVFAGFHTQFGNMVVIRCIENGFEYLHMLCHMKKISSEVVYNKRINAGTIIGVMGMTGTATGIHLHYQVEILTDGDWQSHPWVLGCWQWVDPKNWLI